jgi:AcrR family transcriptional regulator
VTSGVAAAPPGEGRPGEPKSRRRGDALLQAIFEAVLAELAEHGFGGLSIERVAERAHTGKASIYRRWPSRIDLVVDAFDHLLPDHQDPPDTGTIRGDLVAVLCHVARVMNTKASSAARACVMQLQGEPEVAAAVRDRVLPARRAMMIGILQRAADRGQIRPDAVSDRIAEVGPALLHAELVRQGSPLTTESVETIVDEVLIPMLRP